MTVDMSWRGSLLAIYNGLSFFVSEILTWIPVLQQLTTETSDLRVTVVSLKLIISLSLSSTKHIVRPINTHPETHHIIGNLLPGPGLVVTTDHAEAGNDHNEWHHTMNQSGVFIRAVQPKERSWKVKAYQNTKTISKLIPSHNNQFRHRP